MAVGAASGSTVAWNSPARRVYVSPRPLVCSSNGSQRTSRAVGRTSSTPAAASLCTS
ncbi:hypothetical protein GCM10009639_32650 [Kitasatospora putterlickiae]|uniref:Uncharacterized protein n=1 Tax=Kitasatospora putterlickiae TaxID=221725 RepID=A0ABP4ITU0_9ACTN